jgi:hypothetical protein
MLINTWMTAAVAGLEYLAAVTWMTAGAEV